MFGEGPPENGVVVEASGTGTIADVCGAGDTAAAVFTLALAARYTAPEAMYLANAASGVVVLEHGTAVGGLKWSVHQPVWTRRSLNVECRNSAVHRRAPSDRQRPVRVILFDRRNHPVQLGEVFFPKSETSDNSGEPSKRPSRHLISSFTTPCSRKGNHIAHMVSS
jgi:hypothetical protein